MDTTLERTHYDTLGVAPDADAAAVKTAYRKLARELHPDVAPDGVDTAGRFALANVAYAVLADPAARELYDLALTAPKVPEVEVEVPEEPWGEQVELEVNISDAAPVVGPVRHRAEPTWTVNRARLIWAVAWTVVPLVVALFAPGPTGAPSWVFYGSLAVGALAAHRALFSTRWSIGVLVLAVLVAAAMPLLVRGDGAAALAVAVISGVPLVGAGELMRSTRSDR